MSYFPKVFFEALDTSNEAFRVKNTYLRNKSKNDIEKHAILYIFFPDNYYRGTIKNRYMGLTEFLCEYLNVCPCTYIHI